MSSTALKLDGSTAKADSLNTLLVVEDDDIDYMAIERHLLSGVSQYKIIRARTIKEAKSAVSKNKFCAALIDYRLGTEVGLDFLTWLGGENAPFAVIMMTGYDDKTVNTKAYEAGAIDFLQKSALTRDLLLQSVKYAIREQDTLAELRDARAKMDAMAEAKTKFLKLVKHDIKEIQRVTDMLLIKASSQNNTDKDQSTLHDLQKVKQLTLTLIANCEYVRPDRD
ncbi:MAG: response regulator [Pseudomonadota bacterium]